MKYKVISYGIAKDILGDRATLIDTPVSTVGELRNWLTKTYPALSDLKSLVIAVNKEYAEDGLVISERDEIVLIPPVSGG